MLEDGSRDGVGAERAVMGLELRDLEIGTRLVLAPGLTTVVGHAVVDPAVGRSGLGVDSARGWTHGWVSWC